MIYKLISPSMKDPGDYKQDEIYLQTNSADKLENYIKNLASELSYSFKEFAMSISTIAKNKIVLSSEDLTKPELTDLGDGRVLVRVPRHPQEQLSCIYGGIIYHKAKQHELSNTLVMLFTEMFSRVLSKSSSRNMMLEDLNRVLMWYLVAWFLRLTQDFSISNYLLLLRKYRISSPSKDDANKISKLKDADEVYNKLCEEIDIDPDLVKSRIINRYGIDFLMGFEDGYHLIAMACQSNKTHYPSEIRLLIPTRFENQLKLTCKI